MSDRERLYPFLVALIMTAWVPTFAQSGAAGAETSDWRAKVDPWVLETASATAETEFLALLDEQADLTRARTLAGKAEKGRFVFERLRRTAAATQGPILAELAALGVEHRAFWVANMIWVKGDLEAIQALASRDDIAHLYANPWVPLDEPVVESTEPEAPDAIEWGVAKIKAPDYWAAGFTGQGVVIGGQDTGYDWDHNALKSKYRGWNGVSADHNYHWHDAIHSGGGVCGPNSPEPCDDGSHGTHTMGTMVGDDGGSNQIGVAPGSKWIGCRNMNQGFGTPATYSECFQWFIAPTDLNNQSPDPAMAPDVINNSWSCPPSEGCTDPNVLKTVVENTRAAGILVVVSAGNGGGQGCSTISTPAAIYEASFTIGATNSTDGIANFSSRGPVTVDGSNRRKPNVSAPGVSVRSSVPGNGYSSFSGTSMAGPHVAGQAALLMSRLPGLAGNPTVLAQCIEQTVLPRTTTEGCGGDLNTTIPNNTYGWGRVELAWPLPDVCVHVFGDDFESGDALAWQGEPDP